MTDKCVLRALISELLYQRVRGLDWTEGAAVVSALLSQTSSSEQLRCGTFHQGTVENIADINYRTK